MQSFANTLRNQPQAVCHEKHHRDVEKLLAGCSGDEASYHSSASFFFCNLYHITCLFTLLMDIHVIKENETVLVLFFFK